MRTLSSSIVSLVFLSFVFSSCQDGSVPLNPDASQIRAQSNIVLQTAVIGNYAWLDENMDGIQDEEEAGLGDITVILYDCEENMIASTTTDEEGYYLFEELEAGEYFLGFEAPEGYQFSPQEQGDDDEIDSDPNAETGMTECFALEADSEDVSRDAGFFMMDNDDCTYGKGFWKNHAGMGPQEDLVSDLLPIWLGDDDGDFSMAVETSEMAFGILGQHIYGHPSNGITKLYAHFLTAKLNIANGASNDDISELVTDVDDFLADNDYNVWDELSQEDKQMINGWKGTFEDYNEGEIGPGSCNNHLAIYR